MPKPKDNNEMSYPLRVNLDLWRAFKVKCVQQNVNMSDKIRELIKKFVEEK